MNNKLFFETSKQVALGSKAQVLFFLSAGFHQRTLVATMPQLHQGPLMNIASTSMAPSTLTHEADAAERACTEQAKADNLIQVAALSDGVDQAHVAEHIRGLVAVTMAHLAVDASTATVGHAEHWQGWALGVADGVERGVPAVV